MIQIHSGETSRPLATLSLVRSLRDLIKARFPRFRHYLIDDRGTYERSTWSKSSEFSVFLVLYCVGFSTLLDSVMCGFSVLLVV